MFESNTQSKNFTNTLIDSKRYWIIYLAFIAITCVSTITNNNKFANPAFEIAVFIIVALLGIFCITYYFMHDSKEELFKVAFVIILCFGIISALIVPIVDVSDELEHLTRAEITSRGELIPHWVSGEKHLDRLYNHTEGRYSTELNTDVGFETIESHMFFLNNREHTVLDTPDDTDKINQTPLLDGSAFEQNPFYGYLPQAIGIFIAKLFDMNVIWMMWLPRMFNLICYAGLIALAIKIAPAMKVPLLAVACIPISIYQAASVSIDSMVIGLGILTIAYFIYLYRAKPGSLETRQIAIFCALSLLLGLCKLPYLAFVFLILLVPQKNFKNKNILIYMLLGILVVAAIGILWSSYSTPALMHSWRSKLNWMDPALQLNYLIAHPMQIVYFLEQIFTFNLGSTVNGLFNFFGANNPYHYYDRYIIITIFLWIFLAFTLLFYPNKVKFDLKASLGSLIILLMIYIGTCFIQLLTWADVGSMNLGVSARYFIPLFALLSIIVPFKINRLDRFKGNYDRYAMIFIIGFMATLILAFATKYY